MKKAFILFAVAGSLVACNNSSEGTNGADTTTKMTSDTMTNMTVDTTHHMMSADTVHTMGGDTTSKMKMTTTTKDTVIKK